MGTKSFIDEAEGAVATLDEPFQAPPAPAPVPPTAEEFRAMQARLAKLEMDQHKPVIKADDSAFKFSYEQVDEFLRQPDNPFRIYRHISYQPDEHIPMRHQIGLSIDAPEDRRTALDQTIRRTPLVMIAMEEPPLMIGQDLKGHTFIMGDLIKHENVTITPEECAELHARGFKDYEPNVGYFSIAQVMAAYASIPKSELVGVITEKKVKSILRDLYAARKSREGADATALNAMLLDRSDAEIIAADWQNAIGMTPKV